MKLHRDRASTHPIPIETRSLPALARSYPRHFTFYVADPISSIPDLWQQEAVRALQQGKDSADPAFAAASAE